MREWTMRIAAALAASTLGFVATATADPGSVRDRVARESAVPAELQQARVELGRRLFFDERVSRTGTRSCASCHDPEHGFSDSAHPSSDEFGPSERRSMTVVDLVPGTMHSDGEFPSLRALLTARLGALQELSAVDQDVLLRKLGIEVNRYGNFQDGAPGFATVGDRVGQNGFYAAGFEAAFGDERATTERVIDAIEAYSLALRSAPSPVDRFLADGDGDLSADAQAGLALFTGKAGCSTCHVTTSADGIAPLRDGLFHDTGVAWRTARRQGSKQPRTDADPGRGAHAHHSRDRRRHAMAFKTPSLRGVAERAPYMHDGSLATLRDVVDFYDRGGAPHAGLDENVRPLGLSDVEKEQLVVFLRALSPEERPGLGDPPEWLGRETTLRVVDARGDPVADTAVSIEAAGDRFGGVERPRFEVATRTDDRGRIRFGFPLTTHARVRVAGHSLASGGLIPDYVANADVTALPETQVALRVITSRDGRPKSIRAVPRATMDELGRPLERREGDSITFTFARKLSERESLYVARLPKKPGSRRRTLVPRGGDGSVATSQADVDWRPGAISLIDMRPVRGAGAKADDLEDNRRPIR